MSNAFSTAKFMELLSPFRFISSRISLKLKSSPRRASYWQASQEALKNLPLASLAPQPVNGRCLTKINFLDNSKVVDLFSLHSMFEAKAFLLFGSGETNLQVSGVRDQI